MPMLHIPLCGAVRKERGEGEIDKVKREEERSVKSRRREKGAGGLLAPAPADLLS